LRVEIDHESDAAKCISKNLPQGPPPKNEGSIHINTDSPKEITFDEDSFSPPILHQNSI